MYIQSKDVEVKLQKFQRLNDKVLKDSTLKVYKTGPNSVVVWVGVLDADCPTKIKVEAE